MLETTLVTGATGFAGSHLLDRLADRAPLVAWYRSTGTPPDPHRHIDWRPVDLLNAADVARGIAEATPSQIFHLAGASLVTSSFTSAVPHLRTNVLGTHHLIEAVRRSGQACRVLVVTSSQVYQPSDEPLDENAPMRPATPYGLSKLAQDQLAERAFRDDGLDVVIARPFNHAGPRQSSDFAVASFLLSDGAGYINGEVVTIDGGEWLQGAGQFNFLRELSDADWQALKPKKRS